MNDQKNDNNSPPQTPRLVRDADIKRYAADDATVDGTDSLFQAFTARLVALADIITNKDAAGTAKKFHNWVDECRQKFEEMAEYIPSNPAIFVDNLEIRTQSNLTAAKAKYKTKITQLGKDKAAWEKHFGPSLQANLDESSHGNAYWLVGLILFLLAAESVANSQFFAEGSEFGLLGGTLTAITVSFGNILIPLGLAFFGHRWFYRCDSYRVLGMVMIGLFFLWALGFNHLVAQYRESLLAAASQDSSTLNYVLLFALGTAVAGISFWKMWSFLDPYKQARKCVNNLKDAKKKFEQEVYADLGEMQDKCNNIDAEINRMKVGIPARFQKYEANFTHTHKSAIAGTNKIFASYYRQYCVAKVDPDPGEPVVTLENAEKYGVGITDADRHYLAEMKRLLSDQIATATKEWVQKLHDILDKINQLIRKFQTVITAQLQAWEAQLA